MDVMIRLGSAGLLILVMMAMSCGKKADPHPIPPSEPAASAAG